MEREGKGGERRREGECKRKIFIHLVSWQNFVSMTFNPAAPATNTTQTMLVCLKQTERRRTFRNSKEKFITFNVSCGVEESSSLHDPPPPPPRKHPILKISSHRSSQEVMVHDGEGVAQEDQEGGANISVVKKGEEEQNRKCCHSNSREQHSCQSGKKMNIDWKTHNNIIYKSTLTQGYKHFLTRNPKKHEENPNIFHLYMLNR